METVFTFTRGSPLRTVLLDSQEQPVYKIETPFKWHGPTTTISRYSGSYADQYDEEIARIHWHCFTTSFLVFDGRIVSISKFLKRAGLLNRKFQAPDGREFKWIATGLRSMKLVLNDGTKTLVAKMTDGWLFTSNRKSRIEIFPAGQSIIDLIIITYVYVNKIRRDVQHKPNIPIVF
ncbi:hypothetical protein JAAARDRAFT_56805 [Jaapia argillacea MUCL 33604]|uniref:DUF6593 domain-containing protein n=1 Tax=Jaapia argillacea MUCL 33604 TaxID=933084 RepID=A0A067PYH7_9AGAM|nr:hypothetical protein JAAARDRAFT_56805 [Jaapia argillacea MUCL 33604]